MSAPTKLQFAPFSSALDAGFWYKLSQNKLDLYKLDEEAKSVHGFYSNNDPKGLIPRINVDHSAFDSDSDWKPPGRHLQAHGLIFNKNRIDLFKDCDKLLLLKENASQLWSDITSGRAVEKPSLLTRFSMLSFADLKKYNYWYWFAFPAFVQDGIELLEEPRAIATRFSEVQMGELQKHLDQSDQLEHGGYFLFDEKSNKVHKLKEYPSLEKPILCFADPCTMESNPGWPLRNLLSLLAYQWISEPTDVEVVCFRDRTSAGVRDTSHSIVLKLRVDKFTPEECPKCVGWEKNERGKLGPRMVDLSHSMDPARLAEASVDLNLKLMRWRLLPDLDLEVVKQTRCLLLGAGTLGCNVARSLMGWGVRTITFVDNGRVSYSNPVRQSLFTFRDSAEGGKWKAEAAADSLQQVFPGMESRGVKLSIPMPGHAVSESQLPRIESDVRQLESLIETHDVIYLLLDTREARWLPTLVAASKRKLVINAAMGFDTFLIVRHGLKLSAGMPRPEESSSLTSPIHGSQLGCYFCNDVVAPGDSTRDRTLDQQCTVSRPGMSMITSALAAELMTSVLQHPDRGYASAEVVKRDDDLFQETSCCLGLVPHQIRGFLSRYQIMLPASKAFDKCTACSEKVISAYESAGFEFLMRAFNEGSYLEDLTGLTQLHEDTKDLEIDDFSDDESI